MKFIKQKLIVGSLLLGAQLALLSEASAAPLFEVRYIGQPVMLMKGNTTSACGIRFLGIQQPVNISNAAESIWVADASYMLSDQGVAMVKALASKTTVEKMKNNDMNSEAQIFKNFWIKTADSKATMPMGNVKDGDTEGSKLYQSDTESVLEIHRAILNLKPITVGYDFADDKKNVAFYGLVSMSKGDVEQYLACMSSLVKSNKEASPN